MNKYPKKIVGIIPAAGLATRISPLPCSKEIYPIGFIQDLDGTIESPKVACHFLLEKMKLAGVDEVFIILGKNKWDIQKYLGNGDLFDVNIAYLIQGVPFGVPFTIDQAYPFVKDSVVVFGYPDVLFEPKDAFISLLSKLENSDAEIILGIFPADKPEKVDMVEMDENGGIREIVIKPIQTDLKYAWGIAVWTQFFSNFLHDYLANILEAHPSKTELHFGEVIQDAILDGIRVDGLIVSNMPLLDIGTGEDLFKAIKNSFDQYEKKGN